jgi:hypothetical protein
MAAMEMLPFRAPLNCYEAARIPKGYGPVHRASVQD